MKKLKRFILYLLAFAFPWLVLFLKDNPGGAFLALFMQATFVGWIPATIWAINVINKDRPKSTKKDIQE
ncbi:Uncharacterised protein (plasmid) [Legionella adelaidensis]|uniref:Proteolipid membrane potential modulator n=1 Tax=Legionella adelaidensis TaxID=45056 RepID=A0A0W0R0Q2_9GAMM|nr:YqaE/Pmp3 family membrane protein [Legionella adelaidensis]KTC64676.1 hypothetical protein Lade_1970 [Legionella adelaidensis]VEH86144.1 Uncharacterised protein [Legionella adelaidensis]